MLRRSPSDPFFETVGKCKRILITHGMGDGFNLIVGGAEQLLGALHPEESQLLQGTAPEMTSAQATQVLAAHVREIGHLLQGPRVR